MGLYIPYYDNFDTSKIRRIQMINGRKVFEIHLSVLEEDLRWAIGVWYTILWWEAMINVDGWTLSPVELVTWTGPERDKETMNKNAFKYLEYFYEIIERRSQSGEYKKEDIYIELVIANDYDNPIN